MKKTKLLIFILIAAMLVVAPLLAACTSEEEGAPPEEEEEGAPPEEEEEEPPEVIELTFGAIFPSVGTNGEADVDWLAKIHEETDGMVLITPYWGASLISVEDNVRDIEKGVCDVGHVMVDYVTAGMDLHKAYGGFVYGVADPLASREFYKAVYAEFPELRAEIASVKIMAMNAGTPYQLISREPVRTLDDLQGMTIKCPPAYHNALSQLGADAITMSMGDVYVALEKGTIDGAFTPYECLMSFDFAEVVKYVTRIDCTMPCWPRRAMNWDSFNSLPPEIQEIFDASVESWGLGIDTKFMAYEEQSVAYALDKGVEFIELSAEDLASFYAILESEARAAAAELDAMGLPGTELFEETRRLIDEYLSSL